ncbi:glycosyltransferase family 2 protein [Gramella sp. GC03-9]|uniref:Glycosyltransferase family 2 protein n=1 Tax=Christiangramia oceanisediminis TaxID=2920386 RepID=A0A9X2KWT5_9FLAO|nr:glycosyltransferase family 2 protein [Gramella oceanisediminis]MCP9199904.1 glycosyltransferase family 2 protein [Gramella oceanisediminis]
MNFENFKLKYLKKEVEHYQNSVPDTVKVSVLVQTYNHEQFLEQCLDSILTQNTNFDFEIILGEDQSSDNTRSICLKYAREFPGRIRLLLHQKENKISVNGIITGNFNAIYNLFSARGKFIAFCEGDDYWTDSSKLQKQVDFLEQNVEFSCCFHRFKEQDVKGRMISSPLEQPENDITSEDLRSIKFHPLLSTFCFQKIQEVHSDILKVLNVDTFILCILGYMGKAGFLATIEPTIYRRHKDGVWSLDRLKKYIIKQNTFIILEKYHRNKGDLHAAKNFRLYLRNIRKSALLESIRNLKIISCLKLGWKLFKNK